MGYDRPNQHLVYLVTVGGEPYIGRTAVIRESGRNNTPGISTRWSEHTRELHNHAVGKTAENRKRQRYMELTNKHCTKCFNVCIVDACDDSAIGSREALTFLLVNPTPTAPNSNTSPNPLDNPGPMETPLRQPVPGAALRSLAEEEHGEPISRSGIRNGGLMKRPMVCS